MSTPQEAFGEILEKYVGQALTALGYLPENTPMHRTRGMFRYAKPLGEGVAAYIEFQLLFYRMGGPSRFRVNLLRNIGPGARAASDYADRVETTLSKLLWDDFHVETLGTPDYWWTFNGTNDLALSLVEAGKLVIGFAIPWLEGALRPDQET